MLLIFPIILIGKAREWIKGVPSVKIATWELMKGAFIHQFIPLPLIVKKRQLILTFRQTKNETLYES